MVADAARSGSLVTRLVRAGFHQPDRGARDLTQLGLESDTEIVDRLADAADPDLALGSLARIAANDPSLVPALRTDAALAGRLIPVLGVSSAFGDHLVRHVEDWRLLAQEEIETSRPSAFGLERALLQAVGADPDGPPGQAVATGTLEAGMDALRRAYRQRLLLVASRDLAMGLDVDDAAAELADLAAAALQAALALARHQLGPDHSLARLAIIALGKCGGRELNYVSDVDVVFVAEPVDGVEDDRALRVATRLAEAVISICSASTTEGTIFPVDPNLRPEGRMGPLVRTLSSHRAYYERWARTWEFQALMKARPVAGDVALGNDYFRTIAPFVWTASGRDNFVDDVRSMRKRVLESLPPGESERELKLGRGGLRDVEFAVQLLQLVHGRGDESLRSPSTLVALEALSAGGYAGREDAQGLAESYRFLRRAEHRIQLQRLRRTHSVPTQPDDLRRLARSMGYRGDAVAAFEADRSRRAGEVRRLHEKLFYRPLLEAVAKLQTGEVRLGPEQAKARLSALGFRDPDGALRHIEALTSGVSRRAAIQRTLLPVMLGWFARGADPDAGLLAFRRCSDALGDTPWYLRMLRDEGVAAERLATVLSSSRYVSEMLVRTPEAISMLGFPDQLQPRKRHDITSEMASVARRNDAEGAVRGVRAVRRHELLRIACSNLLGAIDTVAVGRALTDVSVATLSVALDVARRKVSHERRGSLPMTLAVIGMGRLGGGEMGFASDADVLFVYRGHDGSSEHEAATAAHDVAEEMRRLLALPAPDPALLVDAGLRPEGKQGPLVRTIDAYAAYYRRWSLTWEAQALLRAAPCAGNADLAADFLEMIAPIRYPAEFGEESAREIRRLKARMEAERLPRGADRALNLKLGTGGLSDIEWTVQLVQLLHAATHPRLQTPATLAALDAAVEEGLVSPEDGQTLRDAWVQASRLRDALTLVTGRPTEALPGSVASPDLRAVAHVVGVASPADLIEEQRRRSRRSRAVVERLLFG